MAKNNHPKESIKSLVGQYVKLWENRCYKNGLPDNTPNEIFDLVPSYRKIAIAILKNDIKYLGFEPKRSKYYDRLKKIELAKRGLTIQLNLFE
jgi:predicted phosphoadenosine phosphosulfate sulfurtransferase